MLDNHGKENINITDATMLLIEITILFCGIVDQTE